MMGFKVIAFADCYYSEDGVSKQWWDLKSVRGYHGVVAVCVLVNNDGI